MTIIRAYSTRRLEIAGRLPVEAQTAISSYRVELAYMEEDRWRAFITWQTSQFIDPSCCSHHRSLLVSVNLERVCEPLFVLLPDETR